MYCLIAAWWMISSVWKQIDYRYNVFRNTKSKVWLESIKPKTQFKNIAILTFWSLPLIKNFAVKLRHNGKHMKIDSKKHDKKRKDIMRIWVLTQWQEMQEFHLTRRQQNSNRKLLKNNALRHSYQRLTE